MGMDVGIRVSGVDWDAADVEEVMGEQFPNVLLTGGQPFVLNVTVDEADAASAVVEFVRKLQAALPKVKIHGIDRDLVNVTDIATRAGLTREGARKWTQAENFPAPFGSLTASSMAVWAWTDVAAWLLHERSIDLEECLPTVQLMTQIENCLMKNPDHTTVQWQAASRAPYASSTAPSARTVTAAQRSGAGLAQRTTFRRGLVGAASAV